MRIALVNIVTDRQIDFANLGDLKMWIQTHKAFLSKKLKYLPMFVHGFRNESQ